MVHRMWWGAATGAYGGHGESLTLPTAACEHGTNEWSGDGGVLCGESEPRIAFFRNYIENTTLHPPFEECEGSDDGYVQALHCGSEYHLFRFYASSPYCNMSFKQIVLPLNVSYKQELLDPWRMMVSPIWCGHQACPPIAATAAATPAVEQQQRAGTAAATATAELERTQQHQQQPPPPAGQHPIGPLPAGWGAVGVTVDDDSLPHILTFTKISSSSS